MAGPRPQPRTNMADVARLAGVSTATVSRSLRGAPVAEATRQRVLEAARDLKYVPSPAASHLASGRTQTVAVVVPFAFRWFFSEVISGAEEVLRRAGLNLLLYNIGGADAREHFFTRLPLRRRVDAALVVSSALTPQEAHALAGLDVPLCVLGSVLPGFPSVRISDEDAARTATRHLLALGHERIAMVLGDPADLIGYATTRRRRAGFESALREAGLHPHGVVDEAWGRDGGVRAMERLLAQRVLPTAVLAESDEMALGALRAARAAGLRVPEDLSVVGIDDHDLAAPFELTTVAQPAWQQGAAAATALVRMLSGAHAAPEAAVMPTRLVVRRSTGPPAAPLDAAARRRGPSAEEDQQVRG